MLSFFARFFSFLDGSTSVLSNLIRFRRDSSFSARSFLTVFASAEGAELILNTLTLEQFWIGEGNGRMTSRARPTSAPMRTLYGAEHSSVRPQQ